MGDFWFGAFFGVIIVGIILKCFNIVNVSWFWVLAPILVPTRIVYAFVYYYNTFYVMYETRCNKIE